MGAGGDPFGFNIGADPGAGGTLRGLDLGVRGMRLGGKRRLIVPAQLACTRGGMGERGSAAVAAATAATPAVHASQGLDCLPFAPCV